MVLTPNLRKTFAALWVEGDGNCFWRASAKALWGSDDYWCHLKLVVLGWSSINVEYLVGCGGPLHENGSHYEEHIHAKYIYRDESGGTDYRRDNYAAMLLENVGYFCPNRRYAGDITGILVAEALEVVFKMVVPVDMQARKREEAAGRVGPCRGTGRDGSVFGDNRHSRRVVPTRRANITLRGAPGVNDVVIEELAVTLTDCVGYFVGEAPPTHIPVIDAGTKLGNLMHYAAVVNTDRLRRPLPMSEVAPPLYSIYVSENPFPVVSPQNTEYNRAILNASCPRCHRFLTMACHRGRPF